MALQPQTAEIPLAGGVDLKTDPKLVATGNNLQVVNANFPSVQSVSKRYGQTALPTKALGTVSAQQSVVSTQSKNLLTYNQSTAGDTGTTTGILPLHINNNNFNDPPASTYTLTTVTSPVEQGSNSIHFTGNYYGDGPAVQFPVTAGTTYTASLYVYSAITRTYQLTVVSNAPADQGVGNSANLSVPANTWTRIHVTYGAMTGATQMQLGICKPFDASNPDFYIDALQVEVGSTATSWVPGVGAVTIITTQVPRTITQGKALGEFNGELLEYDGSTLYGYSPAAGAWIPRGSATETTVTAAPIGLGATSITGYSSAVVGNVQVYAWQAGAVCYYAVRDNGTGTIIIPATPLPLGVNSAFCYTNGTDLFVAYVSEVDIRAIRILGNAPGNGIDNTYVFQVGQFSSATYALNSTSLFVAGYQTDLSSGTNNYTVSAVSLASGIVTATSAIQTTVPSFLALTADASQAIAVSAAGTALKATAFNATTLATQATFAETLTYAPTGVGVFTTGTGTFLVYLANGRTIQVSVGSVTGTVLTLLGFNGVPGNLQPAVTPWVYNGTLYDVMVSPQTNLLGVLSQQATYYFGSLSVSGQFTILGRFFADAAGSPGIAALMPTVSVIGSVFYMALAKKTALRADASGTLYAQTGLYAVQLAIPAVSSAKILTAGYSAMVSIGTTYSYDGSQLVEDGFWEFPDGIAATTAANGTAAQVYATNLQSSTTTVTTSTTIATNGSATYTNGQATNAYIQTVTVTTLVTGAAPVTATTISFLPSSPAQSVGTFTSTTSATNYYYVLSDGMTLIASVNGGPNQTITLHSNEFANITMATPAEVATAINGAFSGTTAYQDTTLTNELIISTSQLGSGQTLQITGGTAVAALGLSTALVTGGGSGLSAGQYYYQITYEWVDAAGNIHYSAPSYPVDSPNGVTTLGGASVTLTIPYTALTLKPNVTVNIYRSTVNTSSPLYKIGSVPNVPSLQTFQYTDTQSDTQIEGQQFLYAPSDGSGELENDAPPAFKYSAITKARAFGIAQDDPYTLWYSKPLLPGRPVEWSSAQTVTIEAPGGLPTGLGYDDTYAIIFKNTRTYYLPGDGPNAGGGGSQFGAIQTMSTTAGCVSSNSILNAENGVYFQSQTGFGTVQSLKLSTVEAALLATQPLVQALTLTGAQSVPTANQFRWTSLQGTALVYDYLLSRWVTYTNYDAVGYTTWNGTTARLKANGQVFYEDPTRYDDNGTPVQMLIETAYLKPASMAQGFAAAWYAEILGSYISPHNLVIEVEYDYLGVPSQMYTFNAAQNGNLGTYGSGATYGSDPLYGSNRTPTYTAPYQIRVSLQRQVFQSIKFKIFDSQITGASATLSVLALQLGVIGGVNRVPLAQQV